MDKMPENGLQVEIYTRHNQHDTRPTGIVTDVSDEAIALETPDGFLWLIPREEISRIRVWPR